VNGGVASQQPRAESACRRTAKDGQKQEKTVWWRVAGWGPQAEPGSKYLAKGRQVMVVGEVEEPRVFTDKSGNTRAALEIKASQVKFLGQKGDGPAHDNGNHASVSQVANDPELAPF